MLFIKILLVASYSGISGATKSLISLANGINSSGNEVIVLIPKKGEIIELLEANNIKYIKIRLFNWIKPINEMETLIDKLKWRIKSLINHVNEYRIRNYIKNESIDIVHINTLTAHWGASSAILLNKKLVWHIREFMEEGIFKEFRNEESAIRLIRKSNVIIAVSDSIKEYYSSYFGQIKRVYNGVVASENSFRKQDISEVLKLVFVGRLVEGKGLEEIINALEIVKKSGINVSLDIYGKISETYYKDIKEMIDIKSLNNIIRFKNYHSNIEKVLGNYNISLVTSNKEAFGRVTVESMMSKTVVIGSNTGGTRELIKSNQFGLLYQQGDSKDLASKIIYVYDNYEKYDDIVEDAYEYAKKNYTEAVYIESVIEEYKTLVNIQ